MLVLQTHAIRSINVVDREKNATMDKAKKKTDKTNKESCRTSHLTADLI